MEGDDLPGELKLRTGAEDSHGLGVFCTEAAFFDATRYCACRKSNTYIQMMESAKKWRRQNATNGMYRSRRRRVLVDRKVRASRVIVGCVRSQQMAKMPLAEHDNVVKTNRSPSRNIRSATAIAARLADPEWSLPEGGG